MIIFSPNPIFPSIIANRAPASISALICHPITHITNISAHGYTDLLNFVEKQHNLIIPSGLYWQYFTIKYIQIPLNPISGMLNTKPSGKEMINEMSWRVMLVSVILMMRAVLPILCYTFPSHPAQLMMIMMMGKRLLYHQMHVTKRHTWNDNTVVVNDE